MNRHYIAIVIAGSTNGGKTSATERLVQNFPNSIVINQDDYFYEPDSIHHTWLELSNKIRHQDWERYESLDWAKFDKKLSELDTQLKEEFATSKQNNIENSHQNLEAIKLKVKLILIEGHCLLCHKFPKFFNVDRKIFLTLSEKECKNRRLTRVYVPPDPPMYFEEIVWPTYVEQLNYARKNHPDALFLNGELDKETIFQQIKKEIDDVYLSLL